MFEARVLASLVAPGSFDAAESHAGAVLVIQGPDAFVVLSALTGSTFRWSSERHVWSGGEIAGEAPQAVGRTVGRIFTK